MRVARVAFTWLVFTTGFLSVSCRYGYEPFADLDAPNGGREEDAEGGANDEEGGAFGRGGRANALGGSTGEPGARGGTNPGTGGTSANTGGTRTGEAEDTRTCGGRLESPTEPPSVTPSAQVYSSGAPIPITFTGAQDWQDWIGIYFDGERPGSTRSLFWFYIDGSRRACKLIPSGTVVFDATNPGRNRGRWPPAPGNYRVFLLAEGAYEIRALRPRSGSRSAAERGLTSMSLLLVPAIVGAKSRFRFRFEVAESTGVSVLGLRH